MEQYIEIPKTAQNVKMIGLNSDQAISPIPPPFLQCGQKTQILPL